MSREEMGRPVRMLGLALLCAVSPACPAAVGRINPQDGLGKIGTIRTERPPRPISRIDASITVKLQASTSLGCVFVDTADPAKARQYGQLSCVFFVLGAGDERAQVKQEMERRGSKLAYFVENGGQTLAALLQHHLAKRFRSAQVVADLGSAGPAQIAVKPVIEYYQDRTGPKHTLVTLSATRGSDPLPTGTGHGSEAYTTGHLGWAIPVMLFFPVGTIVAAIAIQGINDRTIATSLVRGMDDAAEDIAEKVAGVYRGGLTPSSPTPAPSASAPPPSIPPTTPAIPPSPAPVAGRCTKDTE